MPRASRIRVSPTGRRHILTAQLTLPYTTSLCENLTQHVCTTRTSDKQTLQPREFEALRATMAGVVFTRTQAIELVGHILDNVK